MKILSNWMMGFVTLAVITFIGLQDPFVKETLRLKSFDLLAQYEEKELSPDIGIVTIDEASIEKYGQYPWNRDVLADIVYRLRAAEVGIIVMPILFSEPDRLGGDEMFMISLHQMGVVIAQVGTNQTHKNAVPRGVAKIGDPLPWLYEWNGMLGPIPDLGTVADGVGVINTAPEIDGVVRRLPLIMRVGEETYPAMAIETIRVATGNPSYQIKAGDAGVIAVRVPGYPTINTDAHARIWLRWNNTFQSVSAAADDYSALKGKTVVVGITAEGLGSIIGTPIGEQYDWALSASALQTVINGTAPKRYDISLFIELMISVLVGLIIVVLCRFTPYWTVGIMMLFFYAGSVYGTYWLFTTKLILADSSWIIIVTTIVGMHSIFNRFILEFKQKQQIKKQFQTYLNPAMVKILQKNPELLKLGGDTRKLSILFADIRGFTPISEQYKTNPQGLTELINRFLTPMTDLIMGRGGTIDKYMGDCIMCFWNAPVEVENHEVQSVKAALGMIKRLEDLNNELESEGLMPIRIGIGINTGEVVVGNMGSNSRFDYSILGDAANLASRLEGQSKSYGQTLILGEETATAIQHELFSVELDKIAVKGKTEGVKIFTVLGNNDWVFHNTSWYFNQQQHEKFLELYRAKQWQSAARYANDLKREWPEMAAYYDIMLDRIDNYKENDPGENWDGTYTALTK